MKRIIFDTDNTIGIQGRPMDDALAFLYLIGSGDECSVEGITCNYGNGTINEVYKSTTYFLSTLGLDDMPVVKGCDKDGDPISEAAQWIVDTVNKSPGEITYLGIGSLSNLYGAYLIDNEIFGKLKEIVLMGGITEPLYVHGGQLLSELNMSENNVAAACILSRGQNITVITGNNCLDISELPQEEFLSRLDVINNPKGMLIAKICGYRFRDKVKIYGASSSYCWDAIAAAYILHPELFTDHQVPCYITEWNLQTGFLNPVTADESNAIINIPRAISRESIQEHLYSRWLQADIHTHEINFSCNGVYLDKLIQPAVLIELAKEPAHGFLLLQRLKDNGLVEESLDVAGFYRTLKKLEKADFISTDNTGSSRSKHTFYLTDLGHRALINWDNTLRNYSNHIDKILDEISELKH